MPRLFVCISYKFAWQTSCSCGVDFTILGFLWLLRCKVWQTDKKDSVSPFTIACLIRIVHHFASSLLFLYPFDSAARFLPRALTFLTVWSRDTDFSGHRVT